MIAIIRFRFLALVLLVTFLTPSKIFAEGKKFLVTCSLFPVYDFTREIVQDKADVKLILRPGVEPHEFEPSPSDVLTLNNSDVFVFTGENMEGWAGKISSSLANTKIIDASENIELINNDPHIWLDISKAEIMVKNILKGICEFDPENSRIYNENAEVFLLKLRELDEKFIGLKKDRTLVFAGEFSCRYFLNRYRFDYVSVFEGEDEPSVKRVAETLKFIRENGVHYIFSDAGGILPITEAISEQTDTKILIFDSAHVVTGEKSFIEIMNDNFKNIEKAISD